MRSKKRGPIVERPPRLGRPSPACSANVSELTDDELLEMAEEQGHFKFLDSPEEDIYTWDDGKGM